MSGKVQFSISVDPTVAAELERVRGNTSRSVIVEAMMMECLGLDENIIAEGRRHY